MLILRAENDSLKLLPNSNDNADDDQFQNLIQKHEPEIRAEDVGIWNLFSAFTERYNRTYKNKPELLKRFRIYKRNRKLVKDYQMHEKGTAVYGETPFSDLSQEEFKKTMLPYVWPISGTSENAIDLQDYNIDKNNIPDNVDWRLNNTVTAVKNQGSCGSCWAFSVTGNIEGAWARKTGDLISLSEQELVDCDNIDQGCSGGLPINAYKEIIRMGGLEREQDYPYSGHAHKCSLAEKEIAAYINGSAELPRDEVEIAAWLASKGPVSIGKSFYS
uniref:Cathepsin propeptide inhibitor domain-containing protein n=1 Tax=Syphacia muris TaxID=451379 RepID=A0A0N5AK81_9BILA